MQNLFTGTGVAVVTPFHNYGTIDFTSLEKVINHIIHGGVQFIVALGTTSEAATLSKDERNAVINFFIETVEKRVPIMLGVGSNNTQEVVNTIKALSFDGIDGILSVVPYYNKPGQKGIYYHFKTIASASPVPMVLYNVPSRTSSSINAKTTLKLAHEHKNIVGIKEASGNWGQIMQIIKNKPEGFSVLSGDDLLTLPLLAAGADGVISVVANAFPKTFSEMVRLGLNNDFIKARVLHYQLKEAIDLLFEDGNPAGVKAALEIMELCKNNLRLPLTKVNKRVYSQLKTFIDQYQSSF